MSKFFPTERKPIGSHRVLWAVLLAPLITSNGVPVRQENGFGLSLTRMTPVDAQAMLQPDAEIDLINLVSAPLKAWIRRPRFIEQMEVVQTGSDPSPSWPESFRQS